MSVILINYTYVHDVMRIWQGPEARPDREFIFPQQGHVNCFQVEGEWTGDSICSAILICLTQILGMDQPEESFNWFWHLIGLMADRTQRSAILAFCSVSV